MLIIKKPVESFASGRQGHNPEAIVIHLANAPIQDAYTRCLSANAKTSYHYMVSNQGQIWQLVSEDSTAWHAPGLLHSHWKRLKPNLNVNLYTIGIALESAPGQKWSDPLSSSSKELITKICKRWNIEANPDTVISAGELNSKIRPEYKSLEVEIPKLIPQQDEPSQPEPTSFEAVEQLEKLKSAISNLELRNAALEKLLQAQPQPDLSPAELKELLVQNTKLAEEIYILQQELGIHEQQKKHLIGKIDSYKRQTSLDMFSIKELIKAIINKIIK
jgi:hypothetical protein